MRNCSKRWPHRLEAQLSLQGAMHKSRSVRFAGRSSFGNALETPYAAARVRVLIGMAYRSLGDEDGAELALNAAKAIFEQLGATPDLAHIGSLTPERELTCTHRLTPRELQVLRLVATGRTNKAIAAELRLSEKTIDRHVSNIFDKLDVPSRTAATALAYERKLI